MKEKKQSNGKVKSIFTMSFSIMRQNKILTAGLIVLFAVLTTICLSSNLNSPSIVSSIEKFKKDYVMPDAWFYTKPIPTSFLDSSAPEGVAGIESGLTANVQLTNKSGNTTYITMFTMEENGFKKYYKVEESSVPHGAVPVWITVYYANENNIGAGDYVTLNTPFGKKECFVEALISCPESMSCKRNEFAWHDDIEYGYVFISRDDAKKAFHIPDISNIYSVIFDDTLDDEAQMNAFYETERFFGKSLEKSLLFNDSPSKKSMDNQLSKTNTVGKILPLIAFAIGICFTLVFIYQIILKQRRNIGLLMALGYDSREILSAFIIYIEIISIIGILIGIVPGISVVRYSVSSVVKKYSLPYAVYVPDWTMLVISAAFLLTVGIISCVLCVGKITKVDPAEAYGEIISGNDNKISKFAAGLKLRSVIKFSALSISRNRSRLITSALSVASSIMLMTAALSFYVSNGAMDDAVFGARFRYDYLVEHDESETYLEDAKTIDGISVIEPAIAFIADVSSRSFNHADVQINAICENSSLIFPMDADGNHLLPDDGIIMDSFLAEELDVSVGDSVSVGGFPLKITGIALERTNVILYISFDTAAKMGYTLPNRAVILCEENADTQDVKTKLAEITGFNCIVTLENQYIVSKYNNRIINTLIIITVLLTFALGTILIYVMIVINIDENQKDYAILNALGIKTSSLIGISFFENALRYILSVIIGVPCGIAVSSVALNKMGTVLSYLPLTDIGMICLVVSLIALLYLVLGMIFAVVKAVRVDPAIALST